MVIPARIWSIHPLTVAIGATLCALAFSLVIFPLISGPFHANADPDKIGELAHNIAHGRGFVYGTGDSTVVAYDRAPVYPLIVAALDATFGDGSFFGLQVLQALLHGLTGLLVYRIGRQGFDHRTALLAQMIHALHPVMLWYTARVWIETTNTFMTTLVVLMAVLLQNEAPARRAVFAGIIFGIAVLTKSVILFLPLVFMAWALLRKHWHAAMSLAIAMAVAVVIIAPWTIRNYVASGRLVPVQTSLGLNLVQGEAIAEHWREAPFSTLALWERGNATIMQVLAGTGLAPGSPAGDAKLGGYVVEGWLRDPATFFRHVAVNAVTYWYLSESALKSLLLLALQIPLGLLAVRGAWSMRHRSIAIAVLTMTVLYFWGVHAVIVGWMRYSVPALPVLILLAAAAIPLTGSPSSSADAARSPRTPR